MFGLAKAKSTNYDLGTPENLEFRARSTCFMALLVPPSERRKFGGLGLKTEKVDPPDQTEPALFSHFWRIFRSQHQVLTPKLVPKPSIVVPKPSIGSMSQWWEFAGVPSSTFGDLASARPKIFPKMAEQG